MTDSYSSSNSSNNSSNSTPATRKRYSDDISGNGQEDTVDINLELESFAVAIVLVRYGMLPQPVFGETLYPTDLASRLNEFNDLDFDVDFYVSPE